MGSAGIFLLVVDILPSGPSNGKALATTKELSVDEVLSKYSDLLEVEHSFRALKCQLEIRPVFHWTDGRIKGHICMCFMAFTFLNQLKNSTGLQYRRLVRTIAQLQLSEVRDEKAGNTLFIRSAISEDQQHMIVQLQLKVPMTQLHKKL